MMPKEKKKIERYIPIVCGTGLLGLIISLYLLSDHSEPLLNLAREIVHHFQW